MGKPENKNTLSYQGLVPAAQGWFLSKLFQEKKQLVAVFSRRERVQELFEELREFLPGENVLLYPAWDTLPFEQLSPSRDVSAARLHALTKVKSEENFLVLTSVDALFQKVLPWSQLDALRFSLELGQEYEREELLLLFHRAGYRRTSLVEEPGDLGVRGNVLDFFSPNFPFPLRAEFLDSTLERLVFFDTDTQRSRTGSHPPEKIHVLPIVEYTPSTIFEASKGEVYERLRDRAESRGVHVREAKRVFEAFEHGDDIPAQELYQYIYCPERCSFFNHLRGEVHIVLEEQQLFEQRIDLFAERILERELRTVEHEQLAPLRHELYLEPAELLSSLDLFRRIELDSLHTLQGSREGKELRKVHSQSHAKLRTQLQGSAKASSRYDALTKAIYSWRDQQFHIGICIGSQGRAKRVKELLLEQELSAHFDPEMQLADWMKLKRKPGLSIFLGHIREGFQLQDEKLVLLSEQDIFGERSFRKQAVSPRRLKELMGSLAQLHEDDFVVHVDYGVGKYKGLRSVRVDGQSSDLLEIHYADSTLCVPVHNISRIQKFSGPEGQIPKLDKLSSRKWGNTKRKVRQSVETLAGELVKLYATRETVKGWRFEPANSEDERFAETFPFSETPDQHQAIVDTLGDMASEKPMDRLICGDVGFGKTEVAIRAAFKCTQHARQVAVLAPTTILVDQHFETFQKRFENYPLKVAALSRFYSSKANKETLSKVADGTVDIVIGTHRLLSADVAFNDLGLLIIDEEHRFGVKQKERLKQMKKQVDVLTLTATPIPRTLHMSLINIRDVSLMSSPPTDRRLIRTYTARYNNDIIRDAILRELQRGGQCYFLHNRVQGIELLCAELQDLVPEARFAFAHGQMSENELEGIMHRFMQKEIDVLVCTTIIESGIDVPNANTILINRADKLGLAQLYQLRGRVGRSERQAYCYFLIPRIEKLGAEASQRLKVLQGLDDLGQGFDLALRDMEIRGAGNILGKEQSGNVLSVGFELYTKILKEAIAQLQDDDLALEESVDPEISIETQAYIPESYVPDVSEKLVLYQRLSSLRDAEDALLIEQELVDRFGHYPQEVQNLLDLMTLRADLKKAGVIKADFGEERVLLSFHPQAPVEIERLMKLCKEHPERYRFGKNVSLSIYLKKSEVEEPLQCYKTIRKCLASIRRENTASLTPPAPSIAKF